MPSVRARPLILSAITALTCILVLSLPAPSGRPVLPRSLPAGHSVTVADRVYPSVRQGVETTGAAAWHRAGFTGQGVRVGILDLGFVGYRDLLGSELPAEVIAESFVPGHAPEDSGQQHGTACAEIIHAMAPDATLYLAYYDGSEVSMGRAVTWLLEQGVDVISHSATGIVGPMDGTGSQCDLVERAAERDALWVNCVGNYGMSHYRGEYLDSDGDGWHEFPNGEEAMGLMPPDTGVLVSLNWDDWAEAGQDYDLFLLDGSGEAIASSANSQAGGRGDLPFEMIQYLPEGAGSVFYLAIRATAADRAVTFDLYALDAQIEFPTVPHSLGTPADSPLALAVGAVDWRSGRLEDFSSQGPSGDNRVKPDLVGPDGVSVAAYAERAFYGTSAAAPHVAGAAALVLSAYPDLSREQLIAVLTANARDLGELGPDSTFGYGALLLPDPATLPQATGSAPPADSGGASTGQPPGTAPISPAAISAPPGSRSPMGLILAPPEPRASFVLLTTLLALSAVGAAGAVAGIVLYVGLKAGLRRRPLEGMQRVTFPAPPEQPCLLLDGDIRADIVTGDNTLGRSRANQIVVAGRGYVSRRHAVLTWDGECARLLDLGSVNGTFVNGVRLAPDQPAALRDGDVVHLGPTARMVARLPWDEGDPRR